MKKLGNRVGLLLPPLLWQLFQTFSGSHDSHLTRMRWKLIAALSPLQKRPKRPTRSTAPKSCRPIRIFVLGTLLSFRMSPTKIRYVNLQSLKNLNFWFRYIKFLMWILSKTMMILMWTFKWISSKNKYFRRKLNMDNEDFLLNSGNFATYSSEWRIKKMKMTKNCQ